MYRSVTSVFFIHLSFVFFFSRIVKCIVLKKKKNVSSWFIFANNIRALYSFPFYFSSSNTKHSAFYPGGSPTASFPFAVGCASPALGIEKVIPGGGFSFPRRRRLPSTVSPSILTFMSNEVFPFPIVPVQEMLNFD